MINNKKYEKFKEVNGYAIPKSTHHFYNNSNKKS